MVLNHQPVSPVQFCSRDRDQILGHDVTDGGVPVAIASDLQGPFQQVALGEDSHRFFRIIVSSDDDGSNPVHGQKVDSFADGGVFAQRQGG